MLVEVGWGMIFSLHPMSLPQPLKCHKEGIFQSVALLIEHFIEVIVGPHAVVRTNIERSFVLFTHFPPMVA